MLSNYIECFRWVDYKEISVNGKSNMTPAGDKANVEEPMMYATKQVFS